jgi:hypothetical protein
MANPKLSGQDLIDELRIALGGLSNAFTPDQYLYFINLGVSETWGVIRVLDLDYFADSSQDTDATQDDYMIDLSTTVREYNLPLNCREIRAIECISPSYTDRVFQYRKFDDPEFMTARREATGLGSPGVGGISTGQGCYYYTIFGVQFMLAQFPEDVLKLKIWYIKSIDEVTIDTFPEILFPFNKKIVDYAAKKAILSTRNLDMAQGWKNEWMDSVRMLAMTVGARESTGASYIYDFLG